MKELKAREKGPKVNIILFEEDLTVKELNKALKKLKVRKTPRPDGIHNEMLKQLGTKGKKLVLSYINLFRTNFKYHLYHRP